MGNSNTQSQEIIQRSYPSRYLVASKNFQNLPVKFTGIFDCQSIVHHEFIHKGKTLNKEIYIDIIHLLSDAVRRKFPEKWRTNSWLLLYNNAPAHWLVLVKDFLAKKNMTTLKHHPHHLWSLGCWSYLHPSRGHSCIMTQLQKFDPIYNMGVNVMRPILILNPNIGLLC